jgi:hypothetical protein
LSPNASYPAKNKASVVTLSWVHGGGAGNPQTEFTLQWSRDGFASHTATVGPTATATQSTTIDFSAEAVGAVITWRVKTKGFSLYSLYSANAAFVVASLPTTPNITAPTAGAPPTTPNPTITHTITSGEQQIARRVRITQGGSEVYNSGWEPTTSLSLVSPFAFANGTAYTLLLAIRNQFGLDSAEDSETFTPAYSGPGKPSLRVTAVNEGGYVLLDTSFSPTQLSGCLLWLAADRITGLLDGAAVASWPDLSGNANHAAQATAGNKPTYKTNIVNGYPVVRFAAASAKFLNLTAPIAGQVFTCFAVIKPTAFGGSSPILSGDTGAFQFRYSSTRLQELVKSFVANIGASTTALSTSAFSVIDGSYGSPNYLFRLNGAADGAGSNAQTSPRISSTSATTTTRPISTATSPR